MKQQKRFPKCKWQLQHNDMKQVAHQISAHMFYSLLIRRLFFVMRPKTYGEQKHTVAKQASLKTSSPMATQARNHNGPTTTRKTMANSRWKRFTPLSKTRAKERRVGWELLLLSTIDQAQLQGSIEYHALHVKQLKGHGPIIKIFHSSSFTQTSIIYTCLISPQGCLEVVTSFSLYAL